MVFTHEEDKDPSKLNKNPFASQDDDDEDEDDDNDDDDDDGDDQDVNKKKNKVWYLERKLRAAKKDLQGKWWSDDFKSDAEKIKSDINHFKKVFEKDPKRAQKLLDKHFPWDNAKELYWLLTEDDDTPAKGSPDINEVLDQRDAEKEWNWLIKEYQVDLRSKFWRDLQKEFNELVEGRKLNPEKVRKYFKLAFNEVKQVSDHYADYEKNKDMAAPGTSARKSNPSKLEKPFFKKPTEIKDWYPKKDK